MITDLWKDYLHRFRWAAIGIIVLIAAGFTVLNYSQQVMVSGYRISGAAAKAVEYYQNGDLTKAEAQYKVVVKNSPRDWFSWNGLANVYRDQNMYGLAEEAYLKAIAINPKYEQCYRNIFNLYYAWSTNDNNQLSKAEPILLEGIKKLPKSEILLEDIITYYSKINNQEKVKEYREILDKLRGTLPAPKNVTI